MKTNNPSQKMILGSIIPKANVSQTERLLMFAGGAYLLYKSLAQKEVTPIKNTIAGAIVLRSLTGYCPVYHAINRYSEKNASNVNIRITTIVNRPILQVYSFWRNLENLPRFMNHLEKVTNIDDKTSAWTAKGPLGIGKLTWKSEIIKEDKGKWFSWKSLPDSSVENVGKVVFKPIGQATEIDVTISYHAPLGVLGEKAATLLNPFFQKMVKDDVENFKYYLESGK